MILAKIKHGTKRWHEERAKGIGASESSALFDIEQPGYAMSAYTLRLVKRGELDPESVFVGDRDLAQMGLELEDGIAKGHARANGWKIRKSGYLIDDIEPLMRASLDYIIDEPTDADRQALGRKLSGPGLLQIKALIPFQYVRAWQGDRPPPYVRCQVQQELACSAFTWGAVGVLIGGMEPKLFRMLPHPRFHDDLRRRIADFWANCVLGEKVPPYDATESTRLALRAQYTPRNLAPGMHNREDDAELDEAAAEYDVMVAHRKETLRRYDLALNRLNGLMGASTSAYTEHWYIDRSISEKRRTVTVRRRRGIKEESPA